MRLIKQRIEDKIVQTSSLLRFNILSRKSALLNSKTTKKEEAIDYLIVEMGRIDLHLDKLLATQSTGETQNEPRPDEQEETEGEKQNEDYDTENQIQDPERIQNKGRPEKSKRMKTHIEQVKEKIRIKESKKKKTTTNESSGKNHIKRQVKFIANIIS